MREQAGPAFAQFLIDQHPLRRAVVARLVMFQAEVGDLIAQREEEIVFVEMMRAEQRFFFRDQFGKEFDVFRLYLKGRGGIRHNIETTGRGFAR